MMAENSENKAYKRFGFLNQSFAYNAFYSPYETPFEREFGLNFALNL